jgi:rubrerythrin
MPETQADFDELNRALAELRNAAPSNVKAGRWECLECARVCDLRQDDYCPTCGAELPEA